MMENQSNDYFLSYEDLKVHEIMLRDTVRNEAYKNAIMSNKELIQGKVVLDVGAGTGILSIFCAQAGAAKVYAIEASDVSKVAQKIVEDNEFTNIVKIIHSRIEDVQLPEKVDIIVSEWMGFYLLHEGMLDSVIFARDNFLKEGGLLFPQSAALYAAPCRLPNLFDFWENVSGVKMNFIGQKQREAKANSPQILTLPYGDIVGEEVCINWLSLKYITKENLDLVEAKFVSPIKQEANVQGIALWFECHFPNPKDGESNLLSTSPKYAATHWEQTVFVLPTNREVMEVGTPIVCSLKLIRDKEYFRRYDIQLEILDAEDIEHPLPCNCFLTKCILAKACLETYEANMTEDSIEDMDEDEERRED